jgi:hypothetical protein
MRKTVIFLALALVVAALVIPGTAIPSRTLLPASGLLVGDALAQQGDQPGGGSSGSSDQSGSDQGVQPSQGSQGSSRTDVNVNVRTEHAHWYANPLWIVVGAVVLILLIVVIVLSARGGGSSTTVVRG